MIDNRENVKPKANVSGKNEKTAVDILGQLASTMSTHQLTRLTYKDKNMEVAMENVNLYSHNGISFNPNISMNTNSNPSSDHDANKYIQQKSAPSLNANQSNTQTGEATNQTSVTSPMVGTIYLASSPNAAPFIKIGDFVQEGQQLFIIECMKTMNKISAPVKGKITQILATDKMPTEFGQTLAIIEKA